MVICSRQSLNPPSNELKIKQHAGNTECLISLINVVNETLDSRKSCLMYFIIADKDRFCMIQVVKGMLISTPNITDCLGKGRDSCKAQGAVPRLLLTVLSFGCHEPTLYSTVKGTAPRYSTDYTRVWFANGRLSSSCMDLICVSRMFWWPFWSFPSHYDTSFTLQFPVEYLPRKPLNDGSVLDKQQNDRH